MIRGDPAERIFPKFRRSAIAEYGLSSLDGSADELPTTSCADYGSWVSEAVTETYCRNHIGLAWHASGGHVLPALAV
jgi:hypothetical protein